MSKATVLTNEIIDYLFRNSVYAWRASSVGVFDAAKGGYRTSAKKGVADILGIQGGTGRLIAIEVKIGKDKLSVEQKGFLKNVEHYGGITYVAKDLLEFQDWFLSVFGSSGSDTLTENEKYAKIEED